ncbi:tetratricopeptide repeat protein [Candidatus Dojkabacteria bacterium]|uniref:Tetratricopeptide repeat protein n=1 Tax=Candidatus Dojkabacteria bacterium TaxID=2099670 RepID=A0A5C7J5N0_9BACT|nr:MAG: tetratricopeptide repeat protein [Candidatus Dojkabacteria bacterium]
MNAGDGVNPEIEVELGELEFGRGMFELALIHYKKALTVDRYNTILFNKIANCYCRLKFPWVAIKYYKQSLSIDSSQH